MREVIRIDKVKENDKPVEFTHVFDIELCCFDDTGAKPSDFDFVVWRCYKDGFDYFTCWDKNETTSIDYRGHLNSGKYE